MSTFSSQRSAVSAPKAPAWASAPIAEDYDDGYDDRDARSGDYSEGRGETYDRGQRYDDDLEYSDDDGAGGDYGSEEYVDDEFGESFDGESQDPDGAQIVVAGPRQLATDRPKPVDIWRARHEVMDVVKEVCTHSLHSLCSFL